MAVQPFEPPAAPIRPDDPEPIGSAAPGSLDDPMRVFRETVALFRDRPADYVAAGVLYFLVVLLTIGVAIGAVGLGLAPGLLLEDENLLAIGGLFGFAVYTVVVFGVALVGYPWMCGALIAAVDRHRSTGQAPGALAILRRPPNTGRLIGFYLLAQLLVFSAAMLFYLPAIPALAAMSLAMPGVVLRAELGAVDAARVGVVHVWRNPWWHAAIWGILLVVAVLLELSIVGLVLLFPFLVVYQTVAFRIAFGTEPPPR